MDSWDYVQMPPDLVWPADWEAGLRSLRIWLVEQLKWGEGERESMCFLRTPDSTPVRRCRTETLQLAASCFLHVRGAKCITRG